MVRPVPMCHGIEDKSLNAEVTGDIAVVARISFNICGESQRGRGLLCLLATVAAKLLPPTVAPSPLVQGKIEGDWPGGLPEGHCHPSISILSRLYQVRKQGRDNFIRVVLQQF